MADATMLHGTGLEASSGQGAQSKSRPGVPAGARLWTPRRASFPFAGILSGPNAFSDCDRHRCIVAVPPIIGLLEGAAAGGFVHVGTQEHLQLHKLQHTHHVDIGACFLS